MMPDNILDVSESTGVPGVINVGPIETEGASTPPTFNSSAVTSASVGEAYEYNISASGGSGALVLTMTTGPGWLTLTDQGAGSGVLSGTPGAGNHGSAAVALRVTDASENYSVQSFSIAVSGDLSPTFQVSLAVDLDADIDITGGVHYLDWRTPDVTTIPGEEVDPVYDNTYGELE